MIRFEKGNRCCRFVFKCECGCCFEVIYDLERNCSHNCNHNNCNHNCIDRNKCCKCR